MGTKAALHHVPAGTVTLDARFVAETILQLFEVEERLVVFNGDETAISEFISGIGEDLYRASFAFEHDENGNSIGLWQEIIDLAQARAKEPITRFANEVAA